jgi:hypothetical protein
MPMSREEVEVLGVGGVANLALQSRLLDALRRLGEIEGTVAATITAFDPLAAYRRRVRSVLKPTAAQESSTRRCLARLQRAGLIVNVGRRRRLAVYRLTSDAAILSSLSLGPLE